MTKVCTLCEKEKPLDEFYVKHQGAEGRTSRCKRCMTDQVRRRQKAVAAGQATPYVGRGRPSRKPHAAADTWRKRALDAGNCPCESCRYVRGATPEQRAELIARVAREMGVAVAEGRWAGPQQMTRAQFEGHHARIRAGRRRATSVWT